MISRESACCFTVRRLKRKLLSMPVFPRMRSGWQRIAIRRFSLLRLIQCTIVVISLNVVVEADQLITDVARFNVKDSDKAPTGAFGEESPITPLLEIGILALIEEEETLQPAAREFAASTVIT